MLAHPPLPSETSTRAHSKEDFTATITPNDVKLHPADQDEEAVLSYRSNSLTTVHDGA